MSYRDRFWQLDHLVARFTDGTLTRAELVERHADLLAEMQAEVSEPAEPPPFDTIDCIDNTPPF